MSGARAPYYPTIPTHTSSMYGNAARGVPPSGNAPSCNIHSHSYDMQCDISSTLSAPMIDQPSQVGNVGYNELMPFEPKVPPARPIAVPRQRYARQNFSTSYQVAGTALTQQVSSHRCQAVYRRTTLGEPALGGGQDTWSNTGSGLDPLHQDPEHVSRRNIAFTYAAEAPTASYSDIACQSVQDKRSVTHVCFNTSLSFSLYWLCLTYRFMIVHSGYCSQPFKRTENIAKSHKPVGCNKGPKKGRGRPGRPCFIVTDTKDGLRWERCPSTNDAGVILNLLPNSITKGLSNEDKLNRGENYSIYHHPSMPLNVTIRREFIPEVTRPIKKDKQVSKVNRAKVPASKQGGRQAVLRTLAPEPIAGR